MTKASGRRSYAVLEAPSVLGLKPSGVQNLSASFLQYGLAERTAARYAGRLETPPYNGVKDSETGILNALSIVQWSPALADAVEEILNLGEFPLILGGDCSIVLGTCLALKRRGNYGLLFIDGHADFYQPEAEPHGEAASMDLAFVTGYGPKILVDIEGRGPLVDIDNVFLFGFRDLEEQKHYGSQALPSALNALDLEGVRARGIEAAAYEAVGHLCSAGLNGFLIHVDVDCLDDDIMPAVDYRTPGGLSWEELKVVLAVALASGKAVGLELAIYNPDLDIEGVAGRAFIDHLSEVLGTSVAGAAPLFLRPAHNKDS